MELPESRRGSRGPTRRDAGRRRGGRGHFRTALAAHERSPRLPARARTQLAYGRFLRRNRRRVDARPHLRAALAAFEDLGAAPWAEFARQELRASGVTARHRRDTTTGSADLTAQELEVVRLVQRGLPNRDVAARLFLSPRTIDFHLRNVYAKLGVTSRTELAALALDRQSPPGPRAGEAPGAFAGREPLTPPLPGAGLGC